jgi:hypothetical protein
MVGSERPSMLLIGTGHWGNNGLDVVNPTFDDFLAPRRQTEIAEVIERLEKFHPTKVAVEWAATDEATLDGAYRAYLEDEFSLSASEIHQLGFRLANACGHDRIHAIDWNEGTVSLGDAFDYAKARQPAIFEELQRVQRELGAWQQQLASLTVRDMMIRTNAPDSMAQLHRPYLTIARIGTATNPVGIQWVKTWYERNLIIFANLSRLIASSAERIAVIYGAGHVPLLDQFIRDSGIADLETVAAYLE